MLAVCCPMSTGCCGRPSPHQSQASCGLPLSVLGSQKTFQPSPLCSRPNWLCVPLSPSDSGGGWMRPAGSRAASAASSIHGSGTSYSDRRNATYRPAGCALSYHCWYPDALCSCAA